MNAIEGIGAKEKSESDGWTRSSREHHRPDGPHPGVIAIIVLALSVMALLVPAGMAGGMFFPSPYGSTQTVWMYLTEHRDSSVATGFLTFAASVPLGIFTATVYARLLRLGIRVPGPNIAFAGGITATICWPCQVFSPGVSDSQLRGNPLLCCIWASTLPTLWEVLGSSLESGSSSLGSPYLR